jgi:outer membrane protein TolC
MTHRSPRRRLAAALLLVLAPATTPVPAAAAEGAPPAAGAVAPATAAATLSTAPAPITEAPLAPGADERLELALDDAVAMALRHNLGLAVERFDRAIALFGIQGAEGIYDLLASADGTMFDSESFDINAVAGAAGVVSAEGQRFNLGVSQLVPSGGTLSLGLETARDEFAVGNEVFPTSYEADLGFSVSQPLLRNFGRLATERGIMLARNASDISSQEFERIVELTILDVETAYWNLVEARAQVGVAEESLSLARELHEQNRKRVDVGTLAPLELVQSEAGIATREEGILRAQQLAGDAADDLRRLVNAADAAWDAEIVPVTPAGDARPAVDVGEAIRLALAERPEVRQQRELIENLEVDAAFFRNQRRPRLDVNAGYGTSGTSQQVRNGRPVEGNLGDAVSQIFDRDLVGWNLGFVFSYPIQNRTARANSTIADLDLEQGRAELRDLEQAILTEVRQAARAVETAAKQIDSSRVSVRLAERNLDAERKRYENGLSTSFQILEIQEDLSEARSREVTAVTTYRRALANYRRATGQLLEENGVELADDVERIQAEGAGGGTPSAPPPTPTEDGSR